MTRTRPDRHTDAPWDPDAIQAFVDGYLEQVTRQGDGVEVSCLCPFHDDHSPSMRFNTISGLFICHSCQERGSLYKLLDHFGLPRPSNDPTVAQVYAILDKIDRPPKPINDVVKSESYLDRYKFDSRYWHDVRGISRDTQRRFDLGYDIIDGAVTIPVRNLDGDLIGVIKRFLADGQYDYPFQFRKRHHLFGSWLVAADPSIHRVVLTEGSIDAIKCWQAGIPALAQLGSHLSAQQHRILKQLGVTSVVLFFDNDRAGRMATDTARGVTHQIEHRTKKSVRHYDPETDLCRDFVVSVVRYERGIDGLKNDPGASTSSAIRQAVAKAVRFPLA